VRSQRACAFRESIRLFGVMLGSSSMPPDTLHHLLDARLSFFVLVLSSAARWRWRLAAGHSTHLDNRHSMTGDGRIRATAEYQTRTVVEVPT